MPYKLIKNGTVKKNASSIYRLYEDLYDYRAEFPMPMPYSLSRLHECTRNLRILYDTGLTPIDLGAAIRTAPYVTGTAAVIIYFNDLTKFESAYIQFKLTNPTMEFI